MNKLCIVIVLAVAVCSCYGISDRRSIRSGSEVSAEANPIAADSSVSAPKDLDTAESSNMFSARGKKGGGSNNKNNKMEIMHMGLSYFKMVISTVMAAIGHLFAFKSVGLGLISALIQIAQFIMTLKKSKESHPPSYKIVETPWHSSPTESFGSYGSYAGHAKSNNEGYNASPYSMPSSHAARRRR